MGQINSKVVEVRERMSMEKWACRRGNYRVVMANLEKDSALGFLTNLLRSLAVFFWHFCLRTVTNSYWDGNS